MGGQAYLGDTFSYINESHVKLQGPDATMFNPWNKIQPFKKKQNLWINMTVEGTIEMFQPHSYYIIEADDLYSQNSVSDITAAQLKMLCCRLKSIIQNMRITGGKTCGL
jgi:hypothetical protein